VPPRRSRFCMQVHCILEQCTGAVGQLCGMLWAESARSLPGHDRFMHDIMVQDLATPKSDCICEQEAAFLGKVHLPPNISQPGWAGGWTWGVDTMTAPERRRRWVMLSCTSPVPGGMSMTSTSRSPQLTFFMNASMALITIGPLHTAGESSCAHPFHT
jgi:hypothetical protein